MVEYILCFILISFINAFIIIGAFIAANHKDDRGRMFILSGVRLWFESRLGTYWAKPFLTCYKCMVSIWGGIPALGGCIVACVMLSFSGWYIAIALIVSTLYSLYLCAVVTIVYDVYVSIKQIGIKPIGNVSVTVEEKKRKTTIR